MVSIEVVSFARQSDHRCEVELKVEEEEEVERRGEVMMLEIVVVKLWLRSAVDRIDLVSIDAGRGNSLARATRRLGAQNRPGPVRRSEQEAEKTRRKRRRAGVCRTRITTQSI